MSNDTEGVENFKKDIYCLNESVDVPEQCIMKKTDESMCYQEIGITDVYENLDTVENIINSIPEDLLALVQNEDQCYSGIHHENVTNLNGFDELNSEKDPSVIFGTSESGSDEHNLLHTDTEALFGTLESTTVVNEINGNNNESNLNKRKKRPSTKGDTRQYRQYRKKNRNCGTEYTTNTGKIMNSRSSRSLSDCRTKCKSKVHDNLRISLFNLYWSMNSHDRRSSYISSLVHSTVKKTNRQRRDTPEKKKPRELVYHYSVPIDGNLVTVCKACFLNIFGETSKFVRNICNKKLSSPANRSSPDKRGRIAPNNKKSPEEIKLVIDHINNLPSYESHYCRKQSKKKYLPTHFTLQRAYDEYKLTVEKPVSRSLYEKYFKSSGLKVKSLKKDTCAQCDRYKIQLSNSISHEQRINLTAEKNKHQEEAEQAYETKRNDITTMSTDTCVLSFDLQQCLPTPQLENSVSFYKRQLWTYNLTIHNCKTSNASCYVWYESLAKRGANDISSCLFNYLKNLPKDISNVIMYSDCCPGQNKNGIVIAMCLYFLEQQDLITTIDHKFMVPGHSRMECDSDHGKIEKARKRYPHSISHPYDWMQFIRWAGKGKFVVNEINQDNFFDFNVLLKKKYQMRKKNEDGDKFIFRDVKWFRYSKENKNVVFYKTSLDENEHFKTLDMSRRKSISMDLPKAYTDILEITEEKKSDLLSLLSFIPEVFHNFYQNLKTSKDISDPIVSEDSD
eukprot:XP_016665036.1 PREDICTED: uncharacterized protein LOC107885857 isoform X2 [Acyrthosiphon pisum]